MNLNEAQKKCMDINSYYIQKANFGTVSFDMIYSSIEEMVSDLMKINIPANRTPPLHTFVGYEYIYSFAYYVQHGYTLSSKQITQCKRLALEIKKAVSINGGN